MLNKLRKHSSGWVAGLFMGLIALSFVLWGVADIFSGPRTDVVATVGDQQITSRDFTSDYRRELANYSAQRGQDITPAEGMLYGIDRRVLARLIGAAAIDGEAKSLGLVASDVAVVEEIKADPTFQNGSGLFDKQTFDLVLYQNGLDEAAYFEERRNFIARRQLIDAVSAETTAPNGMAELINAYRNEKRIARYVVLPPVLLGEQAEPTEDELTAYHERVADRFARPELRSFQVMVLRPDLLAKQIAVDEEALRVAYEDRRGDFETPEMRSVVQLPFSTEEAAAAASQTLAQGGALIDVLSSLGQKEDDVTLGFVSRTDLSSSVFADAVFALKKGDVSAPVEGPLAHMVFIVNDIRPGTVSTFEDARAALRAELVNDQALNEVLDFYNLIEDERAGGATLAELAQKFEFPHSQVTDVTRTGLDANGAAKKDLPDVPESMEAIFAAEVGAEIDAIETEDGGYIWIEVTDIQPEQAKPLSEVRAQVLTLWKEQTQIAKLNELADELVARGAKGESIDAIAASLGRSPLTSNAMLRRFSNDTFSRLAVTNLFATPKFDFTQATVGFGDSRILMQVSEIVEPSIASSTDDIAKLNEELAVGIENDLINTLIVALQEQQGTSVNDALLRQAIETSAQ
ncbi:MAG: SurA N-terminal domain-containing protein [Parvibaculaceae bacterium]|nr:SurA N-terminal domain-containing protein [Parvibaculaceae bacterium]